MSARLVRKALEEHEQLQLKEKIVEGDTNKDEDGDDVVSPGIGGRALINPFQFLNEGDGEDDQEADSKSTEGDLDGSIDEYKQESTAVNKSEGGSTSNNKLKKKNNKKKKKGKGISSSSADKFEESLEDVLKELSLDVSLASGPVSSESNIGNAQSHDNSDKRPAQSILEINPKSLNPENELRKIFGSKVMKSFEQSNQSNQAGNLRQIRGGRRPIRHRKTVLVSPLENWPPWDGSLTMEFLETKEGYNYFRYVYSSSYNDAQRLFEAVNAPHDLNAVAANLRFHPYHLDSLMAMSYYYMLTGEHQISTDFRARCLYALECAWHSLFTPFKGNCQLKYSHETNKIFFKTLFSHMKSLDRRACHRSALEVCKLVLSLDSDDPLGAIFCIDYFAIRAEEYSWLEKFSDNYTTDSSLWLFPNYSYSLAISRFYLENEETTKDSLASAEKSTSLDLMKQAIMLHPLVVKKLVAKVPLKLPVWKTILNNSFFRSDKTGSSSLDHLIDIYVERNHSLWKLPELQKFLEDSALQVIETLEHDGSEAKNWICVRKESFSSETNEYGHLLVSDFSDVMPSLTPENLQNAMGGGLGVDAELNRIQPINQQNGNGAAAPRNVANRNTLAVMLESILPWVNYEDAGGERDENNGHGARHD